MWDWPLGGAGIPKGCSERSGVEWSDANIRHVRNEHIYIHSLGVVRDWMGWAWGWGWYKYTCRMSVGEVGTLGIAGVSGAWCVRDVGRRNLRSGEGLLGGMEWDGMGWDGRGGDLVVVVYRGKSERLRTAEAIFC